VTPKTRRWSLLLTVASGLLLIALDNSILYTALPRLVHDLGATTGEGMWIINAYPLVMSGLLLGAGTLGDRIGHRRMFLAGLWIFGAGSLAAAFSPTPLALIAARALLAVGAAAMMPATLALIRVTFEEPRERNLAIAIWGSVALVGAALGPVVGGLLLERFWWGSVFLINVPVVAAALVGAQLLAPRGVPDASRPWDAPSSLLALVALSGLVVGIKAFATRPADPTMALAGWSAALLGGWLFARRQARLPYPLLDFALFRHPAFLGGALAAAFVTLGIGALQFLGTQRFQLVAGFSPLQAGMLVSTFALGALPATLLGGLLLHRVGLRPPVTGGLAIAAVGAAMIALTLEAGLGYTIAGCLVTGAGLGFTISAASVAIIGNAPVHRAGMASSVEEVSYELGALLAVTLFGSLMAALHPAGMALPDRAQAGAAALIVPAGAAYDHAFVVAVLLAAALLAVGAAVTGILLRGPYGRAPDGGH